jgi:nitrite reductase/ring-hydroxylating ferredoxin subunit
MSDAPQASGPDLTQGVALSAVTEGGMLLGHVGEEPVLIARQGADIFVIGATCTHYSGSLAEGLLVDDTVRCPLHHACFSLRTVEAVHAPALNPVTCWRVEQSGETIFVREKVNMERPSSRPLDSGLLRSVVIVGGGAAGNAAAEMLRREGFAGSITMLGADDALPYDRPNLSKNFFAGTAPEDWIPLRSADLQGAPDRREAWRARCRHRSGGTITAAHGRCLLHFRRFAAGDWRTAGTARCLWGRSAEAALPADARRQPVPSLKGPRPQRAWQ